jgi:hypothetical protein
MKNLSLSLCLGIAALFGSSSVIGGELIKGGLLTCTPKEISSKPTVYRFNEKFLVRDDIKHSVLENLGMIANRYMLFGGLTASNSYVQDLYQHERVVTFANENNTQFVNFLKSYKFECENSSREKRMNTSAQLQIHWAKEEHSNVPRPPRLNCSNVEKYLNQDEISIPKPQLRKMDYHITKVTIDLVDWTLIEENFRYEFGGEEYEKGVLLGRPDKRFQGYYRSCQLIELDTIDIDVSENLIPLDDV